MTAKFVWSELKKLVVIDHEINELKKHIKKEQEALELVRAPLVTIGQERDRQAQVARDSQKKIDSLELSLTGFRQDEAKKKAVLDTLTQPSQYQAMERELAEFERKIVGLESQMLTILEEQEIAQKAHDLAAQAYAKAEEEIKHTQEQTATAIATHEQGIAVLQEQWEKQVTHVPSNLSKGYTEIRARVPNPVVPVVSASCSACFYGLLHQDTIAMNNQTIIRCRGCYRFLFLPETAFEQTAP